MKDMEEIRKRNVIALSKYLDEILPENEVLDVYNTLYSSWFIRSRDDIEKSIASRFQVSIRLVELRLVNLGFFMPRA